MDRNQIVRLISLITFFVGFIFINWFLSSRDMDSFQPSHFWIPNYVMGGLILIGTILIPSKRIILSSVAIGGILLGVAFNALTDQTIDRNLFPFEMIIWAVISTPGILAGNLV